MISNIEKGLFLKCLFNYALATVNKEREILCEINTDEELIAWALRQGFCINDINNAKLKADLWIKRLNRTDIKVITIFDKEYPDRFFELRNQAPIMIFARGDINLLNLDSIGIIGSRHPDDALLKEAEAAIKGPVTKKSLIITSGLAFGCDIFGHTLAIENGLKTIACLPFGINKVSPLEKKQLVDKIIECGGLVISEYLPNMPANKFTFVRRDHLIAALSDSIISIKCQSGSGTMHTIIQGFKLNRKLGCFIPSNPIGDFSGHKEIISVYQGKAIRSEADMEGFINNTGYKCCQKL